MKYKVKEEVPAPWRHSMPVASATVAGNLPGMPLCHRTILHGDCTAPVAPCNDVGVSAASAASVRDKYAYLIDSHQSTTSTNKNTSVSSAASVRDKCVHFASQ